MSKDNLRIDSHKLIFHPNRVADWLAGRNIYPIYLELGPSGACNHRCRFCGFDFLGYKPDFMDVEKLTPRLHEMGRLGVKSIMYAGEGEPFLNKGMAEIVVETKAAGIDVALTTNAVFMKPEACEKILKSTSWIKVSINAGTAETYSSVHRTDANDFNKVVENLTVAVEIRKKQNASCILGAQILLLPENSHEVEALALLCREIGLDYLVIKPYSHQPQSKSRKYKDIVYDGYKELAEKVESLSTDSFNVIFRLNTMKAWNEKKHEYDRCFGLPFWSHIDARGDVWGCGVHLQDDNFLYGNIFAQTFEEIWTGEKRMKSLEWCAENLNPHNCRVNCRMDKINSYLWELRNPGAHVNFI
ncbi:radical SAM protein [Maridesulfovibrio hydrothermalis]|uniref:Radical SAM domain protein n=1 Tax=Maridesulfovibrio hydrothermalis AM13 = DSM 14728 TaxID=1121451 RepID=L0RBA2_9BACT|nr:radical SAM protein [Maridesulfovibrio hydrothermalis]CCO23450.1 Radical SAM domain protein [Maridesulfovibrio hydrothermalis AM13 = DSM 14728]